MFATCFQIIPQSYALCRLLVSTEGALVVAAAAATVVGQSVASAVDIFGQKLLNVLCAKFLCAKKQRVSDGIQLNKTIVKSIATIVAIENIPRVYRIVKLL